jgi:hypothetical protein
MLRTRHAWLALPAVLAALLAIAAPQDARAQRSQRQQQQLQGPLSLPEPPALPAPQPQAQPQAAPQPAAPSVDPRAADQPPIPVTVVAPAKSEDALAAERSERERRASLETKLLIFAGLLVAVGLFLTVAFALQALYLWLALRAMRRSARLAERNMTIAQRAFVFVGSLDWWVDGVNVRVGPTWENSGTTPARSLRVSTNWRAWHGEVPGDFVFGYTRPPDRVFLGPRGRAEVGPVLIPIRDIQAAIEQRVHLYFWGRATYEDIFEDSEPHYFEFCYRIEASGATPDRIVLTFAHFGVHNRSDEDSQRPAAADARQARAV